MSNIHINFFGSSSFVVEILENIYQNEGRQLLSVFDEQLVWLKKNYPQAGVLPNAWLDLNPAFFKENYKQVIDLTIKLGLVVSQPDRENRGRVVSNPVVNFARTNSLKVFTPEKINLELEKYVKLSNPKSLSVVASFGQIISQKVLDANSFGFINWHPSLLPKYRGPTPMQSALLNGDQKTGLSWIEVGAKMDAGRVLLQLEQDLEGGETIFEMQKVMKELGKNTWALAVVANITQEVTLNLTQNESVVVFCSKVAKENAMVDPKINTSSQIINHWRAYLEYPGTTFLDNLKFNSSIKLVEVSTDAEIPTGEVLYEDQYWLQTKENKTLKTYLKCFNNSYIQVFKITLESGKRLDLSGYSFI